MTSFSIASAINKYQDSIKLSRSIHTAKTYSNALKFFSATLEKKGFPVETTAITALKEDTIIDLAVDLKNHAPTTERLYLTGC